jgi:hypothetical protein
MVSQEVIKDLIKDYIILLRKDGVGEGELRGIREEIVSATLLMALFKGHFKIDEEVSAKRFFEKNKKFLKEFSRILEDAISPDSKMTSKEISQKFIDAKIFKGEVGDIAKVVGPMLRDVKEAVGVADEALKKERNEGQVKKILNELWKDIKFISELHKVGLLVFAHDLGRVFGKKKKTIEEIVGKKLIRKIEKRKLLYRIRKIGEVLEEKGVIEKKERKEQKPLIDVFRDHFRKRKGQTR